MMISPLVIAIWFFYFYQQKMVIKSTQKRSKWEIEEIPEQLEKDSYGQAGNYSGRQLPKQKIETRDITKAEFMSSSVNHEKKNDGENVPECPLTIKPHNVNTCDDITNNAIKSNQIYIDQEIENIEDGIKFTLNYNEAKNKRLKLNLPVKLPIQDKFQQNKDDGQPKIIKHNSTNILISPFKPSPSINFNTNVFGFDKQLTKANEIKPANKSYTHDYIGNKVLNTDKSEEYSNYDVDYNKNEENEFRPMTNTRQIKSSKQVYQYNNKSPTHRETFNESWTTVNKKNHTTRNNFFITYIFLKLITNFSNEDFVNM